MHLTPAKTTMFSPFWLSAWAFMLSISWLLPNHYHPWLGFHQDAWAAASMLTAAAAVLWRTNTPTPVHRITIVAAVLIALPGLQVALGMIPLSGVAWTSSAYLAGFCLALLIGAQWEQHQPGQLLDGLFLAIGIASVVSVGLQLQQWLQLDGLDELWTMGGGVQRPHGNIGQPNQLATVLLWGLLAIGWAWHRKQVRYPVALLAAAFVLFGVALTGSRTAWIGLTLIALCGLWGRKALPPRAPWGLIGLGSYFVLCLIAQTWVRNHYFNDGPLLQDTLSFASGQQRLVGWTLFADAIARQPWWGYGWYQVVPAHMAVASVHAPAYSVFTSAHNLVLDLFLWCGVPLGLLVLGALLAWSWQKVRAVRRGEDGMLLLFVGVVVVHAMLELPMHYAYILLPLGLVMGVLNVRLGEPPVRHLPRGVLAAYWLLMALLLAVIVRDYARLEPSYEHFRLEQMRFKVSPMAPPEVVVLSQWRAFIEVTSIQPAAGMPPEEIEKIRQVARFFAGPLLLHKLALALALNQQPEEARQWLQTLCKTAPPKASADAKALWEWQARRYPEVAAIAWP